MGMAVGEEKACGMGEGFVYRFKKGANSDTLKMRFPPIWRGDIAINQGAEKGLTQTLFHARKQ